MKKQTKIFILQFIIFAVVFLIIRYLVAHFELVSGIWIPVTAGVASALLCPQFKVFTVEGKEEVYMAWLFTKKTIKVKGL